MTHCKITKLKEITLHEYRVVQVERQRYEIAFTFIEGGEALVVTPRMNAEQIVFELRNLADRIERRVK